MAGGHEEALPVDGRAGVAARVVADTHMALVQLHRDVVIVPIVQQDPVVLCRRDLIGSGTFSSTLSHAAAAQAGRWNQWRTHNGKRGPVCTTVLHCLPR